MAIIIEAKLQKFSQHYDGYTYIGVFRSTLLLGLKETFYAKLVFMSRGKILCHYCLCVSKIIS